MQQAHQHPARPLISPHAHQSTPASSPYAWTQPSKSAPRPFALNQPARTCTRTSQPHLVSSRAPDHVAPHHPCRPATSRAQACTQPRSPPAPIQPRSALPAPVSSSSPHPIPARAQSAPSSHVRPHPARMHPAAQPHPVSPRGCTLLVYPNSAASGSNYSHSTAKSTHVLDRAMETLFEEGPSPAAKKAKRGRSNTIPGLEPLSPEHKPPKMPVRSLTGPLHVTFAEPTNETECKRCEAVIEDARFRRMRAGCCASGAGRIWWCWDSLIW
ncbi:hypothetical protein FIBSPDRAFT_855027 [Athelia psychrophila]|uniref:Uncharacterized protein n=1 Tax=Athelia psychrophila TaxID=1759441 RepID=A0A166PS50_9AGAM|nr:hypothetical protein FIBSPDRAFT_855027 [Fibularhizoctonia sp. CBS 109695]